MNKLNMEQLKVIVLSVLLMIVGILFCCSLSMGIDGLSVVIGLILIIAGVLFVVNSIITNNNVLTIMGLIGVLILSLGILFIVSKLAGIIFAYIPWLLIVMSIVVLVDAFLGKYIRKEDNLKFIIKLVIGCVSLVLGLCLKLIDGFVEYSSIIIGICMIAYAVYLIFKSFIKKTA